MNGGGSNSIHLEDSTLESITVLTKKMVVFVLLQKAVRRLKRLMLKSSVTIQEIECNQWRICFINPSETLPEDSKIKSYGSLYTLDVTANQISLELSNGTIVS